ncbi:response regulator [Desulfitobacterium metallireducens]|uniref:Stage 0 sporulation protein A homolog n=1 Tax=Desulfitobacterium metallireducens DSM 15288 TaxID=871968 RepID=W0ECL3_9FIRM|nr:response regulator [Desulfitobacterium metallireducens]AHF06801.1 membrane protein [Desulfitobacterium metallireducens DSM 15288]
MSIRKAEKSQVNILLVDDHPENLMALEAVLSSAEYQVIKATSGEEALKWVLKEEFAVILLDVQMPNLDGFETARLIKRRKKSKDIPIIFITALSQASEHVQKGYSSGGIDYIFKPFEPAVLIKKVEGFIKIYQTQARIKTQSHLLQQHATELEDLNQELKSTTAALRKAEALARAIYDVSVDTILAIDSQRRIVNANSATKAIFGYQSSEIIGKEASQLIPELEQSLAADNTKLLCTIGLPKKGKPIPIEISLGKAILDDQYLIVCSIRDITERQEIEKARNEQYELLEKLVQERTLELCASNEKLQLSEQLFHKTFEFSPNLMVIQSMKDGRLVDVNESWENITGYRLEEVENLNPEMFKFIEGNAIMLFPQEELLRNVRITYETKSGMIRDGLLSTEVLKLKGERCLLWVVTDITERLHLEKEMARLDRLDLIGEMAAGIAHEIRNPMTTVRGFLQMMKARPQHNENQEYFELMMSELDRANSIITEFLTLSKNQAVELKMDDINVLLKTLFPLIQADAFNHMNDVRMELEEIPNLMLDQREIRQMILNLARNGIDAMRPGGILSLRTFCVDNEVVLEVQDQGSGIESDVLEKLGNPFFTTKENGTGLGLAVCFRIAEKHKARISIKTSSQGTTFDVHFPT